MTTPQAKPTVSIPLFLFIESLSVLFYAVKATSTRRAIAVVNIGFIGHVLFHRRIRLLGENQPFFDMGAGFQLASLALIMSCDAFLCNPQRDLRLQGDTRDIPQLPFKERLIWAVKLWTSPAGVGWMHEPRHHPPRSQAKTHKAFVLEQFNRLLRVFAMYNLNGVILELNPYYNRKFPEGVVGLARLWRLYACGYAFTTMSSMTIHHTIASIVFVGFGLVEPRAWPPLFNSLSEGYSLRFFWGRVWHQLIRRPLLVHAEALTRLFGLPRKSTASRVLTLFSVFFLSGIVHYLADYQMFQDWSKTGPFFFFIIQPVGILLEEFVMKLSGIKGSTRWTRLIGFVWVYSWCALTFPMYVDDHLRVGFRELYYPFSFRKALWG